MSGQHPPPTVQATLHPPTVQAALHPPAQPTVQAVPATGAGFLQAPGVVHTPQQAPQLVQPLAAPAGAAPTAGTYAAAGTTWGQTFGQPAKPPDLPAANGSGMRAPASVPAGAAPPLELSGGSSSSSSWDSRGPGAGPSLPRSTGVRARPADPEERRLLTKRGLSMVMKAAGLDAGFTLDPDAEKALAEFYESFVENALAFGCEVAKKRRSTTLQARDISVHLERQWNIYVPGFEDKLRPYRRPHPSVAHRQRQLAVRRTMSELEAPAGQPQQPQQ